MYINVQQKIHLKVTIKTAFLVVLPLLLSSKRFKSITTEYKVQTKPCVRHLECFERDKKRYQGNISFLCPPVVNLIKAQVCDKYRLLHGWRVRTIFIHEL